ncbi:hypothetical protein BLNAU_13776 [Blattamonas nauphoetae]|uniref:Protein kinase domain-containing protein n=1 Tax=Blattamonas nauphoetae TaxID=2049346 RepID=A0ABQ9XHV5_9EUKA|nr:hypothetical protein BLNAU_13776 [Blattamonas nauphoetae]
MFNVLLVFVFVPLSHPVLTAHYPVQSRTLPYSVDLEIFFEEHTSDLNNIKRAPASPITLSKGQYRASRLPIESETIHLCGSYDKMNQNRTALALTRIQPKLDSNMGETEKNAGSFLFSVRNSTLTLKYLHFVVQEPGDSIAIVSDSKIRVENSQITSNLNMSPLCVIPSSFSPTSVHIISCKHLSCDSHHLLPFVQLTGTRTESGADFDLGESPNAFNPDTSLDLSICGIGLSFENQELILGTGPLLSSNRNANIVSLESSCMRNTTSTKRTLSKSGIAQNQRVVTCSILESTNHLYGTLIHDMNEGGSLLCSNSSFLSCQTTLTPVAGPPTFTLQHRTTQTILAASATNQTFSRCTFLSCTSSSAHGGAIRSVSINTSLSVVDSSFLNCSLPTHCGGSIYYSPTAASNSFSCSGSSFVNGSSRAGGALYPYVCYSITLSACFFHGLTSSGWGGAIDTSNAPGPLLVSSCVYSSCSSTNGGGHHINNVSSFKFDSCQFRGNTAPTNQGNDIQVLTNPISHMTSAYFVQCDSTSTKPNILHNWTSTTYSTLVPSPATTSALKSIGLVEKNGKYILQAVTSSAVAGTMLVLVSNEGGYTKPLSSSPPEITRLVSFSFSSSTTASTEVSIGEYETLQYNSTYSVLTASIKNVALTLPSGLSFITPNPPRIIEATCGVGSGTIHGLIKLSGLMINQGEYIVKVKGITDFSFEVSFLTTTMRQESSEAGVLLFGKGSKLTFNTQYWIESVTGKDDGNEVILDPPTISFTTPAGQPRLASVGEVTFSDMTKKTIKIPLTGSQLTASPFTLTLTPTTSSSIKTLIVSFTGGTTGTAEAVVYEHSGKTILLVFGETYTITKVTDKDSNEIFLAPDLTVIVPTEPTRLCSASSEENRINEITVKLSGKVFKNAKSYTVVLSGTSTEAGSSETHEATLTVTGSTSAVEITSVQVLYPSIASNTNQLRYEMNYSVKSMTDSVVEANVHFLTPSRPPRIVSSICELSGDYETDVTVTLQGMRLEMGGSFTLNIEQVGEGADAPPATSLIKGTFSGEENEQQHTLSIKIFGESNPTLRYDTQWKVTSFSSSLYRFVVDDSFLIEVPKEPARITQASCRAGTEWNEAIVQLSGVALTEGSYKATLKGVSDLSFVVSFVTQLTIQDSSEATLLLSGEGSKLVFNKLYELESVTHQGTGKSVHLRPRLVNLTTPAERPRLASVGEVTFSDTTKNTIKIPLTGTQLTASPFTLTLTPTTSSSIKTLIVSFTGGTTGTAEAVVYEHSGKTIQLVFGETYTITKVTDKDTNEIFLAPDLTVIVPTEPTRLCSASSEENVINEITVKLSGKVFEDKKSYTVVLSGTSTEIGSTETHQATIAVTGTTSATVMTSKQVLYPFSESDVNQLRYGMNYSMVSMTDSVVEANVHFVTPAKPPRIVSSICELSGEYETDVTVTLQGMRLEKGGSFTLNIEQVGEGADAPPATSLIKGTFSGEENEQQHTLSVKIFGESNPTLRYDTQWKVTSFSSSLDRFIVDDSFRITVPKEPARIVGTSASLSADGNSTEVKLIGRWMEAGEYEITLNDSAVPSFVISFAGEKTEERESTTQSFSVYGESIELVFGQNYSISAVSRKTSPIKQIWINTASSWFVVPSEPARIIGTSASLSADGNSTEVKLIGRWMEAGEYEITLNDSTVPTFVISFAGEKIEERESRTHSFVVYGQSNELGFGQNYSISTISRKTDPKEPILIDTSSSWFVVPPEPARIVGASASLSADGNSTEVKLIGRWMEAGEYEITLNDSTVPTFVISFVEEKIEERESTTHSFVVYGESIELVFGQNYSISTVSQNINPVKPILIDTSSSSFVVPSEPMRIENGSATLTPKRTEATVLLSSRQLAQGEYTLVLHNSDKMSTVTMKNPVLEGDKLKFVHEVSLADASMLLSGVTYSISSLTMKDPDNNSDKQILVNDDISILIPGLPIVTSASFSYGNEMKTSGVVSLEGSNLLLDGFYVVTVEPATSFVVSFENSTTGSSSELEMGTGKTLSFSQQYELVSIQKKDDEDDVVPCSGVTFTTKERPRKATLIVDWRGTDESGLCGSESKPCKTFDAAWKIISAVGIVEPTVSFDHGGRMKYGISIDSSMSVLLKNGGNVAPTLEVSSEAEKEGEKGVIVVDGGELEILDVDVMILSVSPSFVFLFATDSTIILKDGSIVGPSTFDSNSPSPNNSEADDLCSWTDGIVQLDNCKTNITATVLSHLSQGAVQMKGGSLIIDSSTFRDNSPQIDSFTSIRRNIHCSENGLIEIGSLSGGDGLDSPHAWISTEDCSLKGKESIVHSPYFVPTLIKSSSSSLWNKKNGTFTVTIGGSTLIPCDLFLEVREKTKAGQTGQSTEIVLTLDSTLSFNETIITLSLASSRLSSLDSSLEWEGRLLFGDNERTNTSFVLQKSSSGRLAQSIKDNMKWWLPLVIVVSAGLLALLLILFCCWRRNKTKKEKKEEQEELSQELDIQKDEILGEVDGRGELTGMSTVNALDEKSEKTGFTLKPSTFIGSDMNEVFVEALQCSGGFELTMVKKRETLYTRLHTERGKEIGLMNKAKVGAEIAGGLQKVLNGLGPKDLLSRLTTHWILIDGEDNIHLRLSMDGSEKRDFENVGTEGMKTGESKVEKEGERWVPPEVKNGGESTLEQQSVFRLGLVLYEIESGQIPFGEQDAVNAQRQLGIGCIPNMQNVIEVEMKELIESCICLNYDDRPKLSDVKLKLDNRLKKHEKEIDKPDAQPEEQPVEEPEPHRNDRQKKEKSKGMGKRNYPTTSHPSGKFDEREEQRLLLERKEQNNQHNTFDLSATLDS